MHKSGIKSKCAELCVMYPAYLGNRPGALKAKERQRIDRHLHGCRGCRLAIKKLSGPKRKSKRKR